MCYSKDCVASRKPVFGCQKRRLHWTCFISVKRATKFVVTRVAALFHCVITTYTSIAY